MRIPRRAHRHVVALRESPATYRSNTCSSSGTIMVGLDGRREGSFRAQAADPRFR
jgi:hypothetical protein